MVEFASPSLRESIKGSGYKLEGKNAGIRMEVPTFLRSHFHVLQNLSYKMKLSKPELKCSLRFDDANLGLVLDIQVPGQDWQRIRPDEARAVGRTGPSLRSGPQEMSGDMISGFVRSSVSGGSSSSTFGASASGRWKCRPLGTETVIGQSGP